MKPSAKRNSLYILYLFSFSLMILAPACKKEGESSSPQKHFDSTYTNNSVLYSNLAKGVPAKLGCFYSCKTKTVSDSANAIPANVDISFADIYDRPGICFVSPNRRAVNSFGHLIPTTDLPGSGTTYFSETNLNFDQASADDVFSAPDPAKEFVSIPAQGSVYLFKTQEGKKGIIKVTSFMGVEFDQKYYSNNPPPKTIPITTNIMFSVKVVAN